MLVAKYDTGVYGLVNKRNGKLYVGSSAVSLFNRMKSHLKSLDDGCHCNQHLQHAWNKDKRWFVRRILERCPPEQCIEREQYWIDHFRSSDSQFGYNLSPTAGSTLGLKITGESLERHRAAHQTEQFVQKVTEGSLRAWADETKRERMVTANRNRITPEFRENAAKLQKERFRRPEYVENLQAKVREYQRRPENRKKASERMRGKKLSEETRKKMSISQQKRALRGVSQETREKMRLSQLGKKHSEETRKKISVVQTGRKQTPEHIASVKKALNRPEVKEKMRASHRGKKQSQEMIAKRVRGIKETCAKRRALREQGEATHAR